MHISPNDPNTNLRHAAELWTNNSTLRGTLKIAIAIVLALAVTIGISSVGETNSLFSDVETSVANFLRADPLGFTVELENTRIDMSTGTQTLTPVMTLDEDSEPAQYYVKTVSTEGDNALCGALQVSSTFPLLSQGPLFILLTGTTTDTGPWTLSVTVPPGAASAGAECTVDLLYKAWNSDVPEGRGYKDEEHLVLTFFLPVEVNETSLPQTVGLVEGASTDDPPPSDPPPAAEEKTVAPPAGEATAPPAETPPPEPAQEPTPEPPPTETEETPTETPTAETPPSE